MGDVEEMTGDYGIDSPAVVRGLGLTATGALLVTVVCGILDFVTVMAVAFVTSLLVSVLGLVLIRSSRVHKVRERVVLVDRLELRGDERVLDVGCGRGLLVVEVARRLDDGGRAFGVDVWRPTGDIVVDAEYALHNSEIEGVHHRIDMVSADVGSLPYADASFDAVVSGLALHHIEGFDSRVHAIREIARVLRIDGRVVLFDRHHTRHFVDALRACNFVHVTRSARVWRLVPPARYVSGIKAASLRLPVPAAATAAVATPEDDGAAPVPVQPTEGFDPVARIEPVLTEDAARAAAEEFLDEVLRPEQPGLDLVVAEVIEYPTSWVVGWNTRASVETDAVSPALAGNGPIIVSKRSGFVRLAVSALPVETQLDPEPTAPTEADGQLQLSATVTGERDGAGHETQDGPSV